MHKLINLIFSGALKKDKFLRNRINHRYLRPVSKKVVKKLNLTENFSRLSLVQVILGASVSNYEANHKKFKIKYIKKNKPLQKEIATNFLVRNNIPNPMDCKLESKPNIAK